MIRVGLPIGSTRVSETKVVTNLMLDYTRLEKVISLVQRHPATNIGIRSPTTATHTAGVVTIFSDVQDMLHFLRRSEE